ncbi:MAG TPA: PBP1A family penicillin-binding protein, partial [Gemmatimonadales bacterium]|nr:PBP1A family penicillin-binding protein [Gemmatimonadales bacterium]
GPSALGPVRYLARPIVLQPGTVLEPVALEASLRRLRYRSVDGRNVRVGEFRQGRHEWVIGRRPFRLGRLLDSGGVVTVRLGYGGMVEEIADAEGRLFEHVLVEPEVLHVAEQHRVDAAPVILANVPDHLVDAVLAVEDRRFFSHWGADVRRILGAMVANVRAGRVVQGGSTITQQLAKNKFLTARRTPLRKIRELAMALVLEARHTKHEILEAYLNEIYLGQQGSLAVHGVGAASRDLFSKDVRRLSVAESALLAGLIRAPNVYSPWRHPNRARDRRNLVLSLMRDQGRLSGSAFDRARRASLGLKRATTPVRVGRYFTDYVRESLESRLGREARSRGLVVFTTADLTLQLAAEDAVRDGLSRLEQDRPALRRGGQPLQAALVALDPRTGEIRAMVGGRDYGASQFNRAVQARRQPGSAFKPVVALAALSRRSHTLASVLEDEPLSVETPLGRWEPANYDHEYRGRVTLREALERSLNVPFARLGLSVGPDRIVETARRLGIESPLKAVPSLALGSADLTPLELARAYGVLAAGGELAEAHGVIGVAKPDGATPTTPGATHGSSLPVSRFRYPVARVYDPAETFLVTSALEGAVERGTGRGLRSWGYWGPVAAKSGTTNDHRDAWFVGYTPELVVAVWVGYDDGRSVGIPGARAALPIFARFLTAASGNGMRDPWDDGGFRVPDGIQVVDVDRESGLRAGWGCGGEPEYFLEGTAPDAEADCDTWWRPRWLLTEGERFFREYGPRIERQLGSSVRELRRLAERLNR